MSWLYPHTVAVRAVTESADGSGRMGVRQKAGSTTSVAGDFQRMSPGQSVQEFGVELEDSAKLYVATADAGSFAQGYLVEFESKSYSVVGQPQVRDDGSYVSSYCLVLLQRVVSP